MDAWQTAAMPRNLIPEDVDFNDGILGFPDSSRPIYWLRCKNWGYGDFLSCFDTSAMTPDYLKERVDFLKNIVDNMTVLGTYCVECHEHFELQDLNLFGECGACAWSLEKEVI